MHWFFSDQAQFLTQKRYLWRKCVQIYSYSFKGNFQILFYRYQTLIFPVFHFWPIWYFHSYTIHNILTLVINQSINAQHRDRRLFLDFYFLNRLTSSIQHKNDKSSIHPPTSASPGDFLEYDWRDLQEQDAARSPLRRPWRFGGNLRLLEQRTKRVLQ